MLCRCSPSQAFLPLSYEGSEYTSETFHYEDDGDTQGYMDGQSQWTRLAYALTDDSLTFTVSAVCVCVCVPVWRCGGVAV